MHRPRYYEIQQHLEKITDFLNNACKYLFRLAKYLSED